MDDRPIGVFDSGLGGLTVLKEIRRLLPGENIIYFGDCGRAPYGVKSPETIRRYTFQNIRFFLDAGVKLLVIACNTMSAYGYESVAKSIGIPVVEVIGPGSAAAAKATRNNRIGVIGTAATISSGIYPGVIKRMKPEAEVFMKACPLFVPLAEEGPYWWGHDSARLIAGEYLGDLRNTGIDSLILGCTHYPLLSGVIREAVGDEIALISSAKAVAAEVSATLGMSGILRGAPEGGEQPKCGDQLELGNPLKLGEPPDIRFYTSDSPEKFRPLCESILGEPADKRVFRLEIEKYESELP